MKTAATISLQPMEVEGNFTHAKIRLNEAIARLKNLEVYVNKFYGKKEERNERSNYQT